ncbi:MAG: hypothetical protein ACPGSB_09735, partial [Opitutales bacterium]
APAFVLGATQGRSPSTLRFVITFAVFSKQTLARHTDRLMVDRRPSCFPPRTICWAEQSEAHRVRRLDGDAGIRKRSPCG